MNSGVVPSQRSSSHPKNPKTSGVTTRSNARRKGVAKTVVELPSVSEIHAGSATPHEPWGSPLMRRVGRPPPL